MRKAHEEVDEILGDQQIQLTDISKLKYIDGKVTIYLSRWRRIDLCGTAILRETMRLSPTAPMRTVRPFEDITIGDGKYFVPKDYTVVINTIVAQRDPAVWGEDVRFSRSNKICHC